MTVPVRLVAFQGQPGAYSDLACRAFFPGVATLPCESFDAAFAALADGRCDRAMIPIENNEAGRVADVHYLLPAAGLHIVGEHFQPVRHHLLVKPGTRLGDIREVRSHIQALSQCRRTLKGLGLKPVIAPDTAGAAADLAAGADAGIAAIASALAGEIYGLETLRADLQDAGNNTTRFLVLARQPDWTDPDDGVCVTSFVFRVRNVSAALYKALGGFATNGINLTKLESYVDERFVAAQFYAEAENHPQRTGMRLALEELQFFSKELKILGVYPASPFRKAALGGHD